MDLCLALGVESSVLVPFDRYRAAVEDLTLPSSLARALDDGATAVERVDKLIQALAGRCGMQHSLLDAIVVDVDDRLAANRGRAEAPRGGRQAARPSPVAAEQAQRNSKVY